MKELILPVGYKSEDSWPHEVDNIHIMLTGRTISKLTDCYKLIKGHDYIWSANVWADDEIRYKNKKGVEDSEFYPGAEWFTVYPGGGIYFHAEHKHNSQCYFESKEFTMNDKGEVKIS